MWMTKVRGFPGGSLDVNESVALLSQIFCFKKNNQQMSNRCALIFHSHSIFLYGAMKYVERIHTRYSSQP
jgi:hypothetical protein